MKCGSLNFRVVQHGYPQDLQYLMVSVHFIHVVATLMKSFMPDKLQSRKKVFFNFFDGKTLPYTLRLYP